MLSYELGDYLWGRANDADEEIPLPQVSDDYHIALQKGRLAMCALRDYISEKQVNRALAGYLAQFRYKGPPYPVTTDLVERLHQVAPPELRYLVIDLVESVILCDNQAVRARCSREAGGSYRVVLEVEKM